MGCSSRDFSVDVFKLPRIGTVTFCMPCNF